MESSYLIVNKVIIKGTEKIYLCDFEEGINIIWGDMDSGKSSILNIIDYCLGGKGDELDYDEINKKGRIAYLEVNLNGSLTTFERILRNKDNLIKVYNTSFDNLDSAYPKLCSPIPSFEQPDGWVSDLILEKLNIPKVKIKESKLRDDAAAYRLSFRDLMKLLYLKQNKVASDNLMNASNPVILNKNVEIQKFVYGVHDDQLSELNLELQSNTILLKELNIKTKYIFDFLKSTDSLNTNEDDTLELKENIININYEIKNLIKEKNIASLISQEFKTQLSELDDVFNSKIKQYKSNTRKIENLIRLKATYEHDLQCINTSSKFRTHNAEPSGVLSFNCPLCESKLNIDSPILTTDEIKSETSSLKNRIQGCRISMEALNKKQDSLALNIQELQLTISNIRGEFDKDNISTISPLVETIHTMHNSKELVYLQLASIEKNIKLKNKLNESTDEIENKEITISKLKKSIKLAEERLEDLDEIMNGISNEFKYLMKHSKLSNNYDSSIDNKFLPTFRSRPYSKISSGGVRTIMSVNLYLSRLRYLLKKGGNLPTFLMLDTPGQNIGRYARAKDLEDNLSDPTIYEEIYKQIVNVKDISERNDKKFQIIIVDNDLANCLSEKDYHLVKRFDKSNSQYEKGLIYDA